MRWDFLIGSVRSVAKITLGDPYFSKHTQTLGKVQYIRGSFLMTCTIKGIRVL